MNIEFAILFGINLIIAIGMYIAVKEMKDKLARIMMFLVIMIPSLSTIIHLLMRGE